MKMIFKKHNNAAFNSVICDCLRAVGFALCFSVQPLYAVEAVGTNQRMESSTVVKSHSLLLYAEQWELARTGETVLTIPALNKLINIWLSDKNKSIEIQYPGGEEGEFWVQSLTDWLVSLGIPSDKIVIVPGSGSDDIIKFSLI